MRNFIERLMRKFMGIPESAKLNYINLSAESMEDAESMLSFLCKHGILEGNPDKWCIWTGDGKSFVIEEKTEAERKFAEEDKMTDFFDFAEEEEMLVI